MATNELMIQVAADQGDLRTDVLASLEGITESSTGGFAAFELDMATEFGDKRKVLDDEIKAADASSDALSATLASFSKNVTDKLASLDTLPTEIAEVVTDKLKPIASNFDLLDRMQLTHYGNPKVPVFRWNTWHTHQANFGWMDGNNPRSFGGHHPSSWTDGNARAKDMNGDLKYMQRLFVERGTADQFGASLCQETFIMYSSTTGRVCGSLWRIKNVASSGITWNPEYMYTSFGGWGEYASASVNGADTFHSHCNYSWCRTNINFNIPSNSQKNRVSTVIFISMGSGDNGVSEGLHQRTNGHQFNDNSLVLPDGLEYVDDLDVATGNWKQ